MLKYYIVILILSVTYSKAQSTHCVPDVPPFSIELNYPVPIDNNFLGLNFNGVLDVGVKYRFKQKSILDFGASFNAGVLVDNTAFNQPELALNVRSTAFIFQPRFFGELDFNTLPSFHVSSGVGYSLLFFNSNGINQGVDIRNTSNTKGGVHINFAIAFDITYRIFVQISYDLTWLNINNQAPNISFNKNANLIKLGAGFRL